MASTIKLKNGSGAPTTGDLVQGEPALDLTNKRLYTENASGVVIEVGTNPSTIDINAGTIDGTVIGGSTAAAGSFTTGQFNTSLNVDGTVTADGLAVNSGATDEVARFEGTGSPYISWYQSGARQAYIGSFGNNFSIVGDTPDTTVSIATGGTNRVTVTATGIDVTGTATADGLTVDGSLGSFAVQASGAELHFSRNDNNDILANGGTSASFTIGANNNLTLKTGATLTQRLQIANNGDISFYEDTGTTAKFFWDASAESLGIGTSSPAAKLQVEGETRIYPASGTAILRFGSGGVEKGKLSVDTSSNMAFETANSERFRITSTGACEWRPNGTTQAMTLDSSGNLLVGKTAADGGVNGGEIRSNGETYLTATSAQPLALNRKSTDGALLNFSKDGTIVGSIGTRASLLKLALVM
jgi:hypothetical protein